MVGFLKKLFTPAEKQSTAFCSVVIAAAGSSERMGGQNKLFAQINCVPVIARTLIVMEKCAIVSEIILVARAEDIQALTDICRDFSIHKVTKIVIGGESRLDSVFIGVSETNPKAKLIAIHDGARPLVTGSLIQKTVKLASECGAAAPAVPATDTVKTAVNRIVTGTLEREKLFSVQTPQVFSAELIKAALKNAITNHLKLTDDCMAVEALGATVSLSEGTYENIKITTPIDLVIAEAIMKHRSEVQIQ